MLDTLNPPVLRGTRSSLLEDRLSQYRSTVVVNGSVHEWTWKGKGVKPYSKYNTKEHDGKLGNTFGIGFWVLSGHRQVNIMKTVIWPHKPKLDMAAHGTTQIVS